jgi:hypothetical protein
VGRAPHPRRALARRLRAPGRSLAARGPRRWHRAGPARRGARVGASGRRAPRARDHRDRGLGRGPPRRSRSRGSGSYSRSRTSSSSCCT